MTQQERRYPLNSPFNFNAPVTSRSKTQDQDLLAELVENYTPDVVRERQLLDAAIEAQDEEETVDMAKMMAMLNDADMQPDPEPRTKRVVRFCRICGVGSCGVHPIEIEVD